MPRCTSHYISDKLIRKIIIEDINKIIRQTKNLQELVKEQKKLPGKTCSAIQKEIDNKNKRILRDRERLKNARNLLYDGIIYREEYENDRESIQADITGLENEIKLLEGTISSASTVCSQQWVQRLLENEGIKELDRDTVAQLIDKIYVYEDRHIEIVYKFSNEFDFLFSTSVERGR